MPTSSVRVVTPQAARRLAVAVQHLAEPIQPVDHDRIFNVVRQIGCLQLDPISAVARSHTLVVWSRVGNYDLAHLDTLLWQERRLFEYWAHAASIVLTEDYPLHEPMMRGFPSGESAWTERTKAWLEENDGLRQFILNELRTRGPLGSKDIEDDAVTDWLSSGWNNGRNVGRMLDYLWTSGAIMVAGRKGGQKQWDLTERCLPEWTPREALDDHERVRRAAQKALKALGVATAKQINLHYSRFRYPNLTAVLKELEREGTIQRVQMDAQGKGWAGDWYVHADTLPLLDRVEAGDWTPRTVLLSPFDNLICDRARTETLWDFRFRIEIYVPKEKREFGYYVLPILHHDRLIGRVDPTMDRKTKTLHINAVYAETDAPMTDEVGREVAATIADLAAFLGAKTIAYTDRVPDGWQLALR